MNQYDFEKWSRKIESTINDAADELQKIIDNPRWKSIYGNGVNPIKRTGAPGAPGASGAPGGAGGSLRQEARKPVLYGDTTGSKVGSIFQMIFGFGMATIGFFSGLTTLLSGIFNSFNGGSAVGLVFSMMLMAGGAVLGLFGVSRLKRVKRFREYVNALGKYTFIQLEKLSRMTGQSVKFLKKDLRDMIDRRMFLQGHLDEEETNLIRDYQNLMENQKRLREGEERSNADLAGLSPEGKRIVREGEKYLQKIRKANEQLPGEVISMKLFELENVIRRILEEVKKQPESASDIRKLMNYYLPTTWKLLEAYMEVEEQPVKTEQMLSTQLEIEKTVDTINDACRKMLDQLFMKQAWDISTDISVLNSMLVQEGLKEGEFQLKQ